VLGQLTGGAARTVEDNLVLAVVVDVDKVALPPSRARIWACFALDATKLHWLLAKATLALGDRRVVELRSDEIGAWRTTLAEGHRFEATQALRQVLNRAVAWKIIDSNPAKAGVDNPRRQHPEKRPFESWAEIDALAEQLGPIYAPMVVFAARGVQKLGSRPKSRRQHVDR
jgi:hypothetical protein